MISVDTKKKELVGNYRNGGSGYRPKSDPSRVIPNPVECFSKTPSPCPSPQGERDRVRGELREALNRIWYQLAARYRTALLERIAGFVSVGITSDTAEFAVQPIRCWRNRMGVERYPGMRELTITAGGGGSNGARVRLWKIELQNSPARRGS